MPKNVKIEHRRTKIAKTERWIKNAHRPVLIWITGLPASGKSTIATGPARLLFNDKINTFVLDGDRVRHGLCEDLSFSIEDRKENLRHVDEVAKPLVDLSQN
jgi:adenylylsulfate kinase-like enzyme